MSLSDEQVQELKRQHGEGLVAVTVDSDTGEVVVLRRPSRASWKKFRAHGQDDRRRLDAPENLVRECVVHPDAGRLSHLLDTFPGLAETLAAELIRMAGMTAEPEKKVL